MEVFRISDIKYSRALDGSGRANRWNLTKQKTIYTSCSRALAILERIVNKDSIVSADYYEFMIISIPDDSDLFHEIKIGTLPADWQKTVSYFTLQEIGSDWYKNKKSVVLKVPSALIPQEFNFIINTSHPDFKKSVKLVRNEPYVFDERLIG